jgi:hypothetical protein
MSRQLWRARVAQLTRRRLAARPVLFHPMLRSTDRHLEARRRATAAHSLILNRADNP